MRLRPPLRATSYALRKALPVIKCNKVASQRQRPVAPAALRNRDTRGRGVRDLLICVRLALDDGSCETDGRPRPAPPGRPAPRARPGPRRRAAASSRRRRLIIGRIYGAHCCSANVLFYSRGGRAGRRPRPADLIRTLAERFFSPPRIGA
ncbi:hypothetical protein EVAR_65447_1 [Eumeta japonica]|uniref:Uncharacterized protein n=1 Tax=Eumeta variegata TaxID=151549 RepID=A0A4C1ZAQ4_EUMVA|nr:hypothetical protein EVAR_65447_1 [Eumeta japonica]